MSHNSKEKVVWFAGALPFNKGTHSKKAIMGLFGNFSNGGGCLPKSQNLEFIFCSNQFCLEQSFSWRILNWNKSISSTGQHRWLLQISAVHLNTCLFWVELKYSNKDFCWHGYTPTCVEIHNSLWVARATLQPVHQSYKPTNAVEMKSPFCVNRLTGSNTTLCDTANHCRYTSGTTSIPLLLLAYVVRCN